MSAGSTARAAAEIVGAMGGLGGIAALATAAVAFGKLRAESRATARQMIPNGGRSLRDAVDRIERAVADQRRDIGGLREELRQATAEREHIREEMRNLRR